MSESFIEQEKIARERWEDQKMIDLIPKVLELISQKKSWDHLFIGTKGYYPGMKDLSGAPLRGISFANLELDGIFFDFADCRETDFSKSFCLNCQFTGADLSNANLHKAYFDDCQFGKAKLVDANFNKADLHYAILMGADTTRANFSQANLRGANFIGAKINDTNFDEAEIEHIRFGDLRKI